MQGVNNYDKEVFNGDPGYIVSVDAAARRVRVRYASSGESRTSPSTVIATGTHFYMEAPSRLGVPELQRLLTLWQL